MPKKGRPKSLALKYFLVDEKVSAARAAGSKPSYTCKICKTVSYTGMQATRFCAHLVKCPLVTEEVLVDLIQSGMPPKYRLVAEERLRIMNSKLLGKHSRDQATTTQGNSTTQSNSTT
eukprot:133404-Amorphochlora_amoeboformis.AAC.2